MEWLVFKITASFMDWYIGLPEAIGIKDHYDDAFDKAMNEFLRRLAGGEEWQEDEGLEIDPWVVFRIAKEFMDWCINLSGLAGVDFDGDPSGNETYREALSEFLKRLTVNPKCSHAVIIGMQWEPLQTLGGEPTKSIPGE